MSVSAPARPRQRRSPALGSRMSTRQMVKTVMDGRLVTLALVNGQQVDGYLGGMDDYHWLIVRPDAEVVLVHKAAALTVTFAKDCRYVRENHHDAIEKIVGPFREYVAKTYYGRDSSMSGDEERN